MSGGQRHHQCLIFVVHEERPKDVRYPINTSRQLAISGFVLLSQALKSKFPKVLELFAGESLKCINNNEVYPDLDDGVKNDRVEIVEVILDENSLSNSSDRPPHLKHLYVERYNADIVQTLLGSKSFIQFEAKFYMNNIRTSLVDKNLKFIEHLLSLRADLRYRHSKGGTILHLALERGDDILARLLLAYGANFAIVRYDGSTALHLAAQKGRVTIVRSLLDAGGSLTAKMRDGSTPLHLAAENGHSSIVRLLLSQGASVNATALSSSFLGGATPLHIAIEKKNSEIVKLLLENGANVDAEAFFGITVLQLAIEHGSSTVVGDVLSFYPDIHNANNKRAFRLAVCRNDEEYTDIVNKLLSSGFMVEEEDVGNAELFIGAIRKNSLQIIRKLLEYGAQVNEMLGYGFFSEMPLHTAARYSEEDTVQLLLDAGADPKGYCERGCTPVDDAFQCVNLKALKVFVANNVHDRDDHELFLTAIKRGWLEIVESLYQNSPVVTVEKIRDKDIFFMAARKGDARLVEFAIKHGIAVDVCDNMGRTALHEAADRGFLNIVEILLRNGANVDAISKFGRSPILEPARLGLSDVVELLLKFGARVDIKDGTETTALHEAAANRPHTCLRTILEYNFTDPKFVSFAYESHGALELKFKQKLKKMIELKESRGWRRSPSYYRTQEIFSQHAVKLSAANLGRGHTDKSLNGKDLTIAECKAEIEKMKTHRLGDTNVTFHDVFRDHRRVPRYLRNPNIVQILNSAQYKFMFPIYGNIVKYQFQKGMFRKELLETGTKISGVLFDHYTVLPDHVKETILNYLHCKDLLVLVNAFKNEKPRSKVQEETNTKDRREENIGLCYRLLLQLVIFLSQSLRQYIQN